MVSPTSGVCNTKPQTAVIGNNSVQFITESVQENYHFWPGINEKGLLSEFLDHVRPDDVVYDIGAHVGLYTIPIAKAVPDGHVVAFEPHSRNAERVTENAELNGLDVTVFNAAVDASAGTIQVPHDDPPTPGRVPILVRSHDQTMSVPLMDQERIREQGAKPPSVVKIDVERAESDVISGLHGWLTNAVRVVLCEIHPSEVNPTEVIRKLGECGFKLSRVSENHLLGKKVLA